VTIDMHWRLGSTLRPLCDPNGTESNWLAGL
jgi:hypothetical protein